MPARRRASLLVQVLVLLTLSRLSTASLAIDADQPQLAPAAGEGWQLLAPAAPSLTAATTAQTSTVAMASPPPKTAAVTSGSRAAKAASATAST